MSDAKQTNKNIQQTLITIIVFISSLYSVLDDCYVV